MVTMKAHLKKKAEKKEEWYTKLMPLFVLMKLSKMQKQMVLI